MAQKTTSVLIVGGGPVGLALAAELGLAGIDCHLVEKRDGALHVPKMSQVSARSMEFCRRWGVADRVRGAVWSENYPLDFVYMRSLKGRELGRLTISSYARRGRLDFTPEGACHCPQIFFDPILAAHVKTLPSVNVGYETELRAFSQDAESVRAELLDHAAGETRTVTAAYLVGCEGAGGVVREALGFGLSGQGAIARSLNIFFRSEALAGFHDKGWARFYRAIDDTGCWAELIPIDGKDLWRLTVFDDRDGKVSPGEYLTRVAGGSFPHDIISAQYWDRRDYVADGYRRGRVFIAGDSAHQCSPTGGLGMHMGMEEAVNLAWKLAAMIRGWGGPRLLDSYEAERRPIALRNVALATKAFNTIAAIPGAGDGAVIEYLRPRMPTFSVSDAAKLHYVYPESPICADEGPWPQIDAGESFVPGTWPSLRAPHAWLDDGRSTLDLFGSGFALLRLGADAPDGGGLRVAADARGVPLAETMITDPAVAKLYERRLVLVRPDGHVAWRADDAPADPGAVIDRVRGA